ncbi:hypothetical protein Ciccas_011393, partial [Cichlidogyrus casuarinus]
MASIKKLLGVITNIDDFCLSVSLPDNRHARVPINEISDAYTSILNDIVENNADQNSVSSLAELYKVGRFVLCATNPDTSNQAHEISMRPADVNRGITKQILSEDVPIYVSIASLEDHGYQLETGIKGASLFLDSKSAKRKYSFGENFFVKIKSDQDKNASLSSKTVNFALLYPGLIFSSKIFSQDKEGLTTRIGSMDVEVPFLHLPPEFQASKSSIKARIYQVDIDNKHILASLLPHIVENRVTKSEKQIIPGTKLDACKLERNLKNKVIFSQDEKRIVVKKSLINKDYVGDLTENRDFECRVIGYSVFDSYYVGNMQKNVLSNDYLALSTVRPGDVLTATYKEMRENGAIFQIGDNISAFVPILHFSDVPLKNPDKIFSQKSKFKCMVLTPSKSGRGLQVTLRTSLVHSVVPVLGSKDHDPSKNFITVMGYVVHRSEKGILLAGCANATGYVLARELGLDSTNGNSWFKEGLFEVGSVLKCRVISLKSTNPNPFFYLSLDLKSETMKSDQSQVGLVCKCTVKCVTDTGLKVSLKLDKKTAQEAILPFSFYSDSHREYGVLVKFPSGVIALAPYRWLADKVMKLDDEQDNLAYWKERLPIGLTVEAKIMQIDLMKRYLVSLTCRDLYQSSSTDRSDLMSLLARNCFKRSQALCYKVLGLKTGAKVAFIAKNGPVEGSLEGQIKIGKHTWKARMNAHFLEGAKAPRKEIDCQVIALENEMATVVPWQNSEADTPPEGEMLKATIVYVNADLTMVKLPKPFSSIGLLSRRCCPNQWENNPILTEASATEVGDELQVKVLDPVTDSVFMCQLYKEEEEEAKKTDKQLHKGAKISLDELTLFSINDTTLLLRRGTQRFSLHVTDFSQDLDTCLKLFNESPIPGSLMSQIVRDLKYALVIDVPPKNSTIPLTLAKSLKLAVGQLVLGDVVKSSTDSHQMVVNLPNKNKGLIHKIFCENNQLPKSHLTQFRIIDRLQNGTFVLSKLDAHWL